LPVYIAIFYEDKPHIQENIYIIVETKRQEVQVNDKDNGIDQLTSYLSSCINSQFGMWTNGVIKHCLISIHT
jgi:type I restriction enzyme M protein